jgi:hypothetical protein
VGPRAISVAGWSRGADRLPVGTRVELDGTNVASLVFQRGRPARVDGYSAASGTAADRLRHRMHVYSSVAVPIVVAGRLWGLMIASSKRDQPLPAHTESRLLGFTELAEAAISKASICSGRRSAGTSTVAKHARAQHATVTARIDDGALRVEVRDDGAGGARSDGSGLLGLRDRQATLDGTLTVDCPPGGGTVVTATIPVSAPG